MGQGNRTQDKQKKRTENRTVQGNRTRDKQKKRTENRTVQGNRTQDKQKKEQKTEQHRETERRTNRKIIVMNINMVNVAIRNRTRNNSDEHKNGKRRNKE